METTIKPADLDDTPLLLGLMQEYYAQDHIPFDEAALRAALKDFLANQDWGRIWLVCLDDLPIGYVVLTFGYSLEFHGRDAILDELYLREFYRGRGIGTQTLNSVQAVARSLGIRAIHLEVERDNEGAQRFYRSLGFSDRARFLLMSKPL